MDALGAALSAADTVSPTVGVGTVRPAVTASGGAAQAPSNEFSNVLSDIIANVADTVAAGETAAISGMKGQMPVQKVVEAVMNAEQTLQGAIAIRDKAVAAYLEISRMAI